MAKIDQMVSALQKLYLKRNAIDKQILDSEKKLVAEAKIAAKPVSVKKPGSGSKAPKAEKPAVSNPEKPVAQRPTVIKPLLKK